MQDNTNDETTTATPRRPARWRKARNPNAGNSRPMNIFIWTRDHGNDQELWRGGVHLATVRPARGPTQHRMPGEKTDGRWDWRIDDGDWHECGDQAEAKRQAKRSAEARVGVATTARHAAPQHLPAFPDIGCGGDCGFQRRGVGLQCVEGSACGRYVHPGDEHSAALEAHRSEMLALGAREAAQP